MQLWQSASRELCGPTGYKIHTTGSRVVQVVPIKTTKQPGKFTFNSSSPTGRSCYAYVEHGRVRTSDRCISA